MPRPPTRSRSRGARLPGRARSAPSGSSPAARSPGRGRGAPRAMLNAMAVTELAPPAGLAELRERYRAFMEEHIYPAEQVLDGEDEQADALARELRERAKGEGLWAPHLPPEAGGTGHGFLVYAYLNEEIGRSVWAQLVFGCQAPDAGNGEILHLYGTEAQKRQWLAPLVAGDVRSFFSMTQPDVSGSDPTSLRTRAVRDGAD